MTDPDGNVATYAYANTAGNRRLASLAHPFGGTTSFLSDSRGQLAQARRPRGLVRLGARAESGLLFPLCGNATAVFH